MVDKCTFVYLGDINILSLNSYGIYIMIIGMELLYQLIFLEGQLTHD
jgi:hypothetical protein